jgi:hypothetical protein
MRSYKEGIMIATLISSSSENIVIVNGDNVFALEPVQALPGQEKTWVRPVLGDPIEVNGAPEWVAEKLWGPHGNS